MCDTMRHRLLCCGTQDSGSPVLLVVDRRYSAFIIGKNGKSITEIEHCSGARVQFEKADQFPPNPKVKFMEVEGGMVVLVGAES